MEGANAVGGGVEGGAELGSRVFVGLTERGRGCLEGLRGAAVEHLGVAADGCVAAVADVVEDALHGLPGRQTLAEAGLDAVEHVR